MVIISTSRPLELILWYDGSLTSSPWNDTSQSIIKLLTSPSSLTTYTYSKESTSRLITGHGQGSPAYGETLGKVCCLKACNMHWCLVQKCWRTAIGQSTVPELHPAGGKHTLSTRFECASGVELLLTIVSVPWSLVIATCFGLYVAFHFMCRKVVFLFCLFIIQTWIYLVKCVGAICFIFVQFSVILVISNARNLVASDQLILFFNYRACYGHHWVDASQ